MKRVTLVIPALLLLLSTLVLSSGPVAANVAQAAPVTVVALTSATTAGQDQGRWWLLRDWFSYPNGVLRIYPTDSGPLAGWTLPDGFDDQDWEKDTRIVWSPWWDEVPSRNAYITELGRKAMVARQGFVNKATYLYRRTFDLPPMPPNAELRSVQLQGWSDNNCVFYLNGNLMYISGWPAGMSSQFTPRQVALRPKGNVLALQLCNDSQPTENPIGVQFRLILHYDVLPTSTPTRTPTPTATATPVTGIYLCLTGIEPASPLPIDQPITVSARAEDPRGIHKVRFIINAATDGSANGPFWMFAEVPGNGQPEFDASATLDWTQAPAGFPHEGVHLIAVNSFYGEGLFSARWFENICRQTTFEWLPATPTPTPTGTAEPTLTPTATGTQTLATPTPTDTATPSRTPTLSPTDTPTPTLRPTDTATPSRTPAPASMQVSMFDWHDPLTWTSQRQRYTITVTNTGPVPLTDVMIVDTIPDGVDVVTVQCSEGYVYDGGATLSWALGTLAPGESQTRYLELRTHAWHRHCTYVVNEIAVHSNELEPRRVTSYSLVRWTGEPACDLEVLP